MSIKAELLEYYSQKRLGSTAIIYKEAHDIIATAPLTFFKDLAKKLDLKLLDIIKLFKDTRIVQFFGSIEWKFSNLYKKLELGYKTATELSIIF